MSAILYIFFLSLFIERKDNEMESEVEWDKVEWMGEREKEKELRLVYQQYTTNRSEWRAYQDISRSPVGWKYIYSNSSSYTAILFLFLYLDQDRNVYLARLGCTTFFLKSIFANLYGV